MNSNQISWRKTSFEDLSTEMIMSIFDYLTSIEILVTFFRLNQRIRRMIGYFLQSGYRLTQFNLNATSYSLYRRFCADVLPHFQSTIAAFELGSSYHYGQIEQFEQHRMNRLDALTLRLIDSKMLIELLDKFLLSNRLQWFDKIHLIMDEETQGWSERIPFCVQNIPVRELAITGKRHRSIYQKHLWKTDLSF